MAIFIVATFLFSTTLPFASAVTETQFSDGSSSFTHVFSTNGDAATPGITLPYGAEVSDVEIELEGERNCRVGVWQAIKYRTLLAVQYGLPLDWEENTEWTKPWRPQIEVSAVLVAHKIDKKVRELCAKYKVKWFEFPPEKIDTS